MSTPVSNEVVQVNASRQIAFMPTDMRVVVGFYNQPGQASFEVRKEEELKYTDELARNEIDRLEEKAQKLIEEEDKLKDKLIEEEGKKTNREIRQFALKAQQEKERIDAELKKNTEISNAKLTKRKAEISKASQKRIKQIMKEIQEKREIIEKGRRQKVDQLKKHDKEMQDMIYTNNLLIGNLVNQNKDNVAAVPTDQQQTRQLAELSVQVAQEEITKSPRGKFIIRALDCMEGCNWKGDEVKLLLHLKIKHQIKEFRCLVKDCTESFDTDNELKVHLDAAHSKGKLHCRLEKCKQSFDKFSLLKAHFGKSHQKGLFACIHFPACSKVAYTRESAYQHRSKCSVQVKRAASGVSIPQESSSFNFRQKRPNTVDSSETVSPQRSSDNSIKKVRT